MKFETQYEKLKRIEDQLLKMIEYLSHIQFVENRNYHSRSQLQFFKNFDKIGKIKTLLVKIRLAIETIENKEVIKPEKLLDV